MKKKNEGEQNKAFSPAGLLCVTYKANSSGQNLLRGAFLIPNSSSSRRHPSAHTDTHGELGCLIRDCFFFPQAPTKVLSAQTSISITQ